MKVFSRTVVTIGLGYSAAVLACDDIAIVARDGRYIIASAEDLTERDVGNLWWLGIRTIDGIVRQSTLERAGIFVEERIDSSGGELPPSELVVLKNLGRSMPARENRPQTIASDFSDAWWLDDSPESELAIVRSGTLAFYDAELTKLGPDRFIPVPLGSGVACEDGERTFIGALRHRVILSDAALEVDELPSMPERDYRSMGIAPAGCTTLIGSLLSEEPNTDGTVSSEQAVRAIDLATNEPGLEFRKKRFATVRLFSGGTLMFEQELDATPVGDNTFRMSPSPRVRVVNLENGNVERSAELSGAGETSRLLCRNESERLIMASENEIYLVDLTSLSIVASLRIPFDRFFIF